MIHEYRGSLVVAAAVYDMSSGDEFYTLIMAAYRFADTDNQEILERAYPSIIAELKLRYNAPGGVLPGETVR